MSETTDSLRHCPTRVDGTAVLFAHKVSTGQCQERQRGRYHKCFTCVHNNALVSSRGPNAQPAAAVNGALDGLAKGERLGLRARAQVG